MSAARPLTAAPPIFYPETDGLPMAENTLQFFWIVVLYGNLAAFFRDRDNVFVSGNQFWYPVQGHPEIVIAPDVYLVFGRPKGHRPSWKQWEEDNVPLTVVFEVRSPSNTDQEMADKRAFYNRHGVEEYYLYDPHQNQFDCFLRRGTSLRRQRRRRSVVSPRLGIRFDLSGDEMAVFYPDGQPFLSFEDLKASQELEQDLRRLAENLASEAQLRADKAELRVSKEQQRADKEQQRADKEQQRAARLVELGRKARRAQATAEELAELERLEEAT